MAHSQPQRNIVNGAERPRNRRQPEFPLRKPKPLGERPTPLAEEDEEELSVRTHPAAGEDVKHPEDERRRAPAADQ